MPNRNVDIRMTAAMLALILTALVVLSACNDDPLAPFEPEVSNLSDSFSLQATGVRGVSLTRNYTWSNSGTTANVNQATTVTAGSATLEILDAQGVRVYLEDLAINGTAATDAGTAGDWTIRLVLDRYSGTLNFSAEAP